MVLLTYWQPFWATKETKQAEKKEKNFRTNKKNSIFAKLFSCGKYQKNKKNYVEKTI